jgi:hypothetical protein
MTDAEILIDLSREYYRAMLAADRDSLRRLFDPRASIIGQWQGGFRFDPVEKSIVGTGEAATGDGPFESRVEALTIAGDIAIVAVRNYCYRAWFTDYLSFAKDAGTWRIVAKTYHVHGE